MNKKLLLSLQKKNKDRLEALKVRLEEEGLTQEELTAIENEIEELSTELDDIATDLSDLENEADEDNNSDEDLDKDTGDEETQTVNPQARSKAMDAVKSALSTRNASSTKKRDAQMRSAFANFIVGNISEAQARSLGIEVGNGSVTIPEVIATEIITYAQEENLLRKYGSRHKTKGNVKYPVLVKKAEANVNKKERGTSNPVPEADIEFDEILLDPAEFDALATVSKKLIKMSGVDVEEIVVEELKKAYVRKEINYMFRGDDVGNENLGALAKKAVNYYETESIDINVSGYSQKLYQQLVKFKGQLVTEVLKKSMWIINRAALTVLEGMTDTTGKPLLYEAPNGVGYKLLGHAVDFTDAADGTDPTKPVFYFGDFKAFHIQDVIGVMELQKLIEKYADTNKVGFQIYNLLDGQLVYSPFEPAVYRYEVGAANPTP